MRFAEPKALVETPLPLPATYFDLPEAENRRFVGRDDVFEKLQSLLENREGSSCKRVAFTGLGGMGKTQVALKYCYRNYPNKYQYVFWITADSEVAIYAGFAKVARILNLPVTDTSKPEIVITAVIQWFQTAQKRWLLVFDNVDDEQLSGSGQPGLILKYFPKVGDGDIIVTTRDSVANFQADTINFDEMRMNMNSALRLLLRNKDLTVQADHSAQELIEELGYLPLAIDLAGACIEQDGLMPAEFLTNYKAHRRDYLDLEKLRKTTGNQYAHTVLNVWEVSFERVEKRDALAVSLLRAFAFLHPDGIPVTFFREHLKQILAPEECQFELGPRAVDTAIRELRSFSLVRRSHGIMMKGQDGTEYLAPTLSIHRLVQTVILLKVEDTEKFQSCQRLVVALNEEVGDSVDDLYDQQLQRKMTAYVPHIRHISLKFKPNSKELISLLSPTVRFLVSRAIVEGTEDLAKLAVSTSRSVYGFENSNTALTVDNLAAFYKSLGKFDDAEPLYKQALAILGAKEDLDTAVIVTHLAQVYHSQGKYNDAEPLYKRALAIRKKILGMDHQDTVQSVNNLGLLYVKQGQFREAEVLLQHALKIRRMSEPDHPDTAMCETNLGMLYLSQGNFRDAKPLIEQALSTRQKAFGNNHTLTAQSKHNLALLYNRQGKFDEVEPLCQQAIATYEELFGPKYPGIPVVCDNLATLYQNQGKLKDAEQVYKKALALREEVLPHNHPYTAISANNLGMFFKEQGRFGEAEPYLMRALAIRKEKLNMNHPDMAVSLSNLASLYQSQGKLDQAEPLYRKALEIRLKVFGRNHPDTMETERILALLNQPQNTSDDAGRLSLETLADERTEKPDIMEMPTPATVESEKAPLPATVESERAPPPNTVESKKVPSPHTVESDKIPDCVPHKETRSKRIIVKPLRKLISAIRRKLFRRA